VAAEQEFRIEKDSMGEVRVPADAKWRAQTQRAVENFPISGQPIERELIAGLALIKGAGARIRAKRGLLDGAFRQDVLYDSGVNTRNYNVLRGHTVVNISCQYLSNSAARVTAACDSVLAGIVIADV
jgi:aspartate ammonia-lyase